MMFAEWMVLVVGGAALCALFMIEKMINRRFDAIEKRLDHIWDRLSGGS